LMTSEDVIHSWWVPAFAVKKDANPGFINEAWTRIDKPGVYRGQCAELCGKDHGFMPIVVEALSEEDFDKWLIAQKQQANNAEAEAKAALSKTLSMEELMAQGEQIYLALCAACHQPNGAGLPGVFPSLIGSPITKGPIAEHIDIVVNGKSGTAMQAFAKQLSATEIAAVVTFERNAWGNASGDTVQAADVSSGDSSSAASNDSDTTIPVTLPANLPEAEQVETAVTEKVNQVVEEANAVVLDDLTMDELMTMGEKVYMTSCVACHQATGTGLPGAFPSLVGSPMITGPISGHLDVVINGKPGTAMQSFSALLTPQQLAAVVTYERNAWGNNSGDAVQASDVVGHGK